MPEGPAPGAENPGGEDSDSDDSIVMPEGTPPPEARLYPAAVDKVPPQPMPPFGMPQNPGYPPHMPPAMPPPFPVGFQSQFTPQSAAGQAQFPPMPYGGNGFIPPPPRGFFPGNPGNQLRPLPGPSKTFRPPSASANLPPRPLGVVNDPLSDTPHQTFQSHRQAQREEAPRDAQGSSADKGTGTAPPPASAEISAAPQLRDLRKEAAVFVPRVAKKKKLTAGSTVITAAPSVPDGTETVMSATTRAGQDHHGIQEATHGAPVSAGAPPTTYNPAMAGGGLMSKLSGVLGTPAPSQAKAEKADEYKTFLAGLEKLEQ